MGKDSKIEWCHHTFNPWWGCTKTSSGCEYCYAEFRALRFQYDCFGAGKPRRLMSDQYWAEPLKWNIEAGDCLASGEGQTRVFCGSMCDIFDSEAPIPERGKLWTLIDRTPNLHWMLLTKRIDNAWIYLPHAWIDRIGDWPKNVSLGVTVENQETDWRLHHLRMYRDKYGIRSTFVSVEPMLERVILNGLRYVKVVFCGCENGPRCWRYREDWARSLRNQCLEAGTAFFYKQALRDGKIVSMPELDGHLWNEIPEL